MDLELSVVTGTERRDVAVQLGGATTVAQLCEALELDPAGLWVGHRYLDGDHPLAGSGLRSGVVVGTAATAGAPSAPSAHTVAVVGGLTAGAATPLRPATPLTVGRGPDAGVRLRDPEVSRVHARLTLADTGDATLVEDAGSRNGVGRRGTRLPDTEQVALGEALRTGETVVEARTVAAVAADLTDDPDTGRRAFNRPPFLESPRHQAHLVCPAEPSRPQGFRMPWAAALLPLVMGGVMFLMFPQYGMYLIVMMALSPLLLVANAVSDRRGGRKSYVARMREYETALARFDADLAAAARDDETDERRAAPDVAELLRRAVDTDATLWRRRRNSPRFLTLRVGLVDRPAHVTITRESTDQPEPTVPTVHDVPATIELPAVGVAGLAGPRDAVLAQARALLVQLATLHSPGDLAITVLTGADTVDDWRWATWLPHTRPWSDGFACHRLLAADGEQATARMTELLRLIDERQATQRARLDAATSAGRAVVVVLDGARRMRAVPGLTRLLAQGPAVGVYAVCLDLDETALPDECGATVVAAGESGTRATLRITGEGPAEDVLVEGTTATLAERAARALTPLHALGDGASDRELPDSVRFTDLAGVQPEPAAIAAAWAASPGGRSSRALLGMAAGERLTVDLVKDGPHGLIAGTSGSGKSELLQTFVASLALANRPDAMNFVLVDYKGGSAFAACAELPHCAGLITDLDGHLVTRALDSLSAELKRRELLLAEAGAKDITDYWARTGARLPRLVIVVDEFASLVEEVPDFVPGVVGIGMRGRSLGVHVVLATQRPGGVVSADMRANLNLRIALRVTSDAESTDVIDVNDAARILPRQPGRAFVRTGHSELTAFQAARVGWPQHDDDGAEVPVTVTPRTFQGLGRAPEQVAGSDVDEAGRTDLTELVAAIRVAAADLDAVEPRRPWLPPLPELVPVEWLGAHPVAASSAAVGLVDRPSAQAQDAFVLDLDRTGPVVIAGAVRSGRSTALRTMAGSLTADASPADLHLYALDCGNHALAALADLPHCGAVVDGADGERTDRLFTMLGDEVARRQRVFMAAGYGSLAEQRNGCAEQDRLPHVVVLLDRLESFVGRYGEENNGVLVERLETLLRTGPAVGVTFVLATDRTGLTHKLGSAVFARLVLAQATPDDLMYFGVDHKSVPGHMPAGRAIWTPTGEEVQVAVLGADPSGTAQLAALRALGEQLTRRWDGTPPGQRPRRLDTLPEVVTAEEIDALRPAPRPGGAGVVTLGLGGDHLGPVDLDLHACGGSFVVCGPARSGRSSALLAVIDSLEGSLPVVVVAPRPSPLRELDRPGVTVVAGDIASTLPGLITAGPVALVVDDAERIEEFDLTAALEQFVRSVRDTGSLLVAAATTEDVMMNRYRGWLATARRDRTGLLLNPASHVDGEVFDLRLPRSTSGGWPAGRGLLVREGATAAIQVACPADTALRASAGTT